MLLTAKENNTLSCDLTGILKCCETGGGSLNKLKSNRLVIADITAYYIIIHCGNRKQQKKMYTTNDEMLLQ